MVSHGKHQRVTDRDDTPMEIPQQEIARAMEEAAAIPVADDDVAMEEEPQPEVNQDGDAPMNARDDDDARTVAEPEMELDADDHEGEDQEEVNSRRPVLMFDTELHVDQELAHVRLSLKVPTFAHIEDASIMDSSGGYARYMAFIIVHHIYKSWPGNTRWLDIPYAKVQVMFQAHKSHDALGSWGPDLSQLDPETGIS